MSKRRRGADEDGEDDVAQLVVRPATVCQAVLAEAGTWRDTCRSLYDIDSKMVVGKDNIQLKIGFFDELQCATIISLRDVALPGNYVIHDTQCQLEKHLVALTITRGPKRAREEPALPVSTSAGGAAASESEKLRLRTVFDVKEVDAGSVADALAHVTRGFGPGEWRLMRCSARPSLYVLHLKVTAAAVPDAVLRAGASYQGVVDFENKQLVLTVDKNQSDIL
jgi:hypothetical protein